MKFLLPILIITCILVPATTQAMTNATERNKFFYEQLIKAIQRKDIDQAKKLLTNRFDVNYQNEWGATALYEAMLYNTRDIAEALIDAGADVNIQTRNGKYAFARTVCLNDSYLVKRMIAAGADVNVKPGEYQWAPLHGAAYDADNHSPNSKQHKISIIHDLFKAGADVNAVNSENQTPLHLAVAGNNKVALELLLQHPDIDIWIKDNEGNTALDSAKNLKNIHPNNQARQKTFRYLLPFYTTLKRITLDYILKNRNLFTKEDIAKLPVELQQQLQE